MILINSSLNAKINKIEGKMLSMTNWAATTTLAAVKNKMSNVSSFSKKKLTIRQNLMKLKKIYIYWWWS